MSVIKSVLDDFTKCSTLPVLAIDKDFNELYSIGYIDSIKNFYINSSILSDINNTSEELEYIFLTYSNKSRFLVVPISRFDNLKGYYIIYVPYMPEHCLIYIYNLIVTISDDKFSKGKSNLNVNLYVKKAIEYCFKYYSEQINIDSICDYLQINKSYFCKLFKEELGITFCHFLNNLRVEKSKHLLLNTDMSLLDVAISVGFNSQSYYTMIFKKFTNQTPIQFRNY